jgi:hypothetical protein
MELLEAVGHYGFTDVKAQDACEFVRAELDGAFR